MLKDGISEVIYAIMILSRKIIIETAGYKTFIAGFDTAQPYCFGFPQKVASSRGPSLVIST